MPTILTAQKYQCFVLCLIYFIARSPPIAPPNNESPSKVFSFVLHAPSIAFFLSMAYAKKVTILINARKPRYTNTGISPMLSRLNSDVIKTVVITINH